MSKKCYAVHDAKAECFRDLSLMLSNGEAIRAFSDEVNRDGSQFGRHPEDFVLFELGSYDETKGVFENLPAPKAIALAIDHKKQVEMFDKRQQQLPEVVQ